MFTSVAFCTFAYCSMLGVLLASLRQHRSVVRLRRVLRSLRLEASVCLTGAHGGTWLDRLAIDERRGAVLRLSPRAAHGTSVISPGGPTRCGELLCGAC